MKQEQWSPPWQRVTLAVSAALITCEALLRSIQSCPEPALDPRLQRKVNAGEIRWSREGFGCSSWGPHGIRAHQTIQPGGVLVLGDSNTEALQVNDGSDYPALLEEKLGTPVYNAGFSGSSCSDFVNYAPQYLEVFRPCWVVIQTGDRGHQLSNSSPAEHLVIRPKIRLDNSKAQVGLLSATRLWQEGRRRKNEIWSNERRLFSGNVPTKRSSPANLDPELQITCKSLAAAYENRLTVLYISLYDPHHPEAISDTEHLFRKHCEQRNIEFVSTSSIHQELARTHQAIRGFPNTAFNFGHVNAGGHRRISGLLEPVLRQRLTR